MKIVATMSLPAVDRRTPNAGTPHARANSQENCIVTQGVLFYSCHRKYYFLTGKNPSLTDVILLLAQEVFFLSQEVFLVTWIYFIMTLEIFPLLQGVLCASHE